jgi:hypothetical protein
VRQLALSEQQGAVAALCRQDEALSAARSCAARAVAAERPQQVAPPDGAGPGLAARQKRLRKAQLAREAQLLLPETLRDAAKRPVRLRPVEQAARLAELPRQGAVQA